jgi:hypothetical protein
MFSVKNQKIDTKNQLVKINEFTIKIRCEEIESMTQLPYRIKV